jgi:4-hydroxy-4-methyl-2-oxoglutarate aldolase
MAKKKITLAEICRRYRRLYTGLVADLLDGKGVRTHSLSSNIRPLKENMVVAGPAFTCQGYPTGDIKSDDTPMLIKLLESLPPYSVAVMNTGGDISSSHWGEIMTLSAKQRGCTGAVVDGGIRDAAYILKTKFPIFLKFYLPASSVSRFELKELQVPIRIGEVGILPGDFILGDVDGVVAIPGALTEEVLRETEEKMQNESGMRQALRRGVPLKEVYKKFGAF